MSENRNGKWCASTDEEHWSDGEEFDTREAALAYAIECLAVENNIEDGDRVYTGQIRAVDLDSLAASGTQAWSVIESMECWMHDNVGDELDYEMSVSKEAEADLDARLDATVRQWMDAHDIKPNCWHIDGVKSEVWKQCAEAVADERCMLHLGHEGAHDFPSVALAKLNVSPEATP